MELDKLDRESVSVGEIGVAAFYASVLPAVTEVARKYGWAVAVHGSMNKDLDLMMMPWVEGAVSADEVIKRISDECFTGNPFQDSHAMAHREKPNGRVVYTISIWKGTYLDINIIERGGSSGR
jgi:hypothetical protein